MRTLLLRTVLPALAALVLFAAPVRAAATLETRGWSPLLLFRFGNLDAVDAEDGDLAVFLKSIRNDGRFIPPMRTFVGPEIRNPTFFGVTYEAWIEGVVLSPAGPGAMELVWVFPVDSRDEYMTQLVNQGLNEYEGMDDVAVLREVDPDGNAHTWYLEWLPGNVAVFGANRAAVADARQVYAENSAAEGLIAPAAGRPAEPDLTLRLDPARLAAWQDIEPGQYWWREQIDLLVADLVGYWNPNPARARLIDTLAEELAVLPLGLGSLDFSVWFEPEGVEWRLRAAGDFDNPPRGQLNILRSLPDRTAAAYAKPVTPATFDAFVRSGAELMLGAAGGVVSQDARAVADALYARLRAAGMREAAWTWVAPPAGRPELGAARMLVADWTAPDGLEAAWNDFEREMLPDTPLSRALAQLGWEASIARGATGTAEAGTAQITLRPAGADAAEPLYDAIFACRRNGTRVAVVVGTSRPDAAERAAVAVYRASLAEECVTRADGGSPDVRSAFTRIDSAGAGLAGILSPVRFLQLALMEAADWRPRSLDQHEPLSTQLAREMLEYASGDAWTMAGAGASGEWDLNGGMSWRSLSRLCAALGITESIGMD